VTTMRDGGFACVLNKRDGRALPAPSSSTVMKESLAKPCCCIKAITYQSCLLHQVDFSQSVQLEIELGKIGDLPTVYSPSSWIIVEFEDLALDGNWAHFAFLHESNQWPI
jgi:hypothetical protein